MPISQPKTPKTNAISPNNAKALLAPKSLADAYRAQWEIKLNKYKPSDKAFILANLTKEPQYELVSSFIKSVAEAAEEQFDKLANQPPQKIQ
jgi:hypothetical protein